ncbi:MAG TPA: hypothetical protein VFC03_08535 [Acidimicrobiales bacterium]|nr:hypothetical protein [Acidimicrobiales bacterium]
MSKHLAQIGVPGQVLDVLAGGDVDTSGRLSQLIGNWRHSTTDAR